MAKPEFVYVTYIAASPEKVWNAIVDPQTAAKYWQHVNLSDWKAGSKWEHREDDSKGALRLVGRVIEARPPRRLVLTWARPEDELKEEKQARVTIELQPVGNLVRLTVMHDRLEKDPEMMESISEGWPKVLSSLKTLLETGQPLPRLW
jgi:uncharacterized protein YndB with AHSA1/START domain